MPYQMFSSEFNTWPKDRGPKAPPAANIISSAEMDRGPTVAALHMPADDANESRSKVVPPPEKVATLINIYPRSLPGEAALSVPIYSVAQLERTSVAGLKMIAQALKDNVEAAGTIPDLPPLILSSAADIVIDWILSVQVKLAQGAGLDVTGASFGVGNQERPSV